MQTNQNDLSIRVQWIYHFYFPFLFNAMRDCLWLVPYDACGTIVKGLCRGTISLYLALWRCAVVYLNALLTNSSCWRGEGLGVRLAAGMIMNVIFPLILACKVTKNTCCWGMYFLCMNVLYEYWYATSTLNYDFINI